MRRAWIILMLIASCADSYKIFQDRIPNGENVPHPCKPNHGWFGVGHKNKDGGGANNIFGLDFKENEFVWDRCLCEKDSDNDGRTNGQELGDPLCVWRPGQIPQSTLNISHPGVCDPYDSDLCQTQNDWEICTEDVFDCPAIHAPDVKTIDLTFPETAVPSIDTSYHCMSFHVPSEEDYHIIAVTPLVDNVHVTHHVNLLGCEIGTGILFPEPTPCGMVRDTCLNYVAVWTVGMLGICHRDIYGIAMGLNSMKTAMLQIHWNNPFQVSTYTDHSGLRVYYTPKLRPNDAGILKFGQMVLNIPPGKEDHVEFGSCPKKCTNLFSHDIFITQGAVHMHYTGRAGSIKLNRNGSEVTTILEQMDYSYDNPRIYTFIPPIEVKPGDSIDVTCHFKTTYKTETIYYGESTADEMCTGYVSYYPAIAKLDECMAFNDEANCGPIQPNWQDLFSEDCDFTMFLTSTLFDFLPGLLSQCQDGCTEVCKDVITEVRSNPCMVKSTAPTLELHIKVVINRQREQLKNSTGMNVDGNLVVYLLHVCDEKKSSGSNKQNDNYDGKSTCDVSGAVSVAGPHLIVCLVLAYIVGWNFIHHVHD